MTTQVLRCLVLDRPCTGHRRYAVSEQRGEGRTSWANKVAGLNKVMRSAGLRDEVARVERLSGGFRNTMFLVTMSSAEKYVVRYYLDEQMGSTEVALLHMIHNSLPAPAVLHSGHDPSAEGRTVVVMEYVGGQTLDAATAESDAAELQPIGRAVGDVLAAMGRIRFDRPGFFLPGLTPDGQNLATPDMILPYVHEAALQ